MIDVLLKHEPKSRSYTKAFGRAILQLWQEECADSQPRLCLRQKIHISAGKTDKDLFTALPVGDTWVDAGMVEVWIYLFQNKKLPIPAGWQDVMQDFNKELQDSAPYWDDMVSMYTIGNMLLQYWSPDPVRPQVLYGHRLRDELLTAREDSWSWFQGSPDGPLPAIFCGGFAGFAGFPTENYFCVQSKKSEQFYPQNGRKFGANGRKPAQTCANPEKCTIARLQSEQITHNAPRLLGSYWIHWFLELKSLACWRMTVNRTVTCKSLDLGLAMVANQHQTRSATDLDDQISDP